MAKISLIAPFPELAELAADVCQEINEQVDIRVGNLPSGLDEAREAIHLGAKVIITRGGLVKAIREIADVPVIGIEVTAYDLIRAILEAKKINDVIGVIGFKNVVYGASTLSELVGVDIRQLIINSVEDVEKSIERASSQGIKVIVGDTISVRTAAWYGLRSVLVKSGKEAIVQAIRNAREAVQMIHAEKSRVKQMTTLIDIITEGIVGIDQKGNITIINKVAEKLLKLSSEQVIGLPASELLPYFPFQQVLQTKSPIIEVCQIPSGLVVLELAPIIEDETVCGILATFQEATKIQKVEKKIRELSSGHFSRYTFGDIYTKNGRMKELILKALKYSRTESSILISGETGTGKEVFAQSIHNTSSRSDHPFVAVNCAAIPETLLESELFGYEGGAFTGAKKTGKPGLFELAHQGTLFLDEVGEIPFNIQARLLRTLQERTIRRVGGERLIGVDVRIISATNRNLPTEVREGRFREDLFHRLNVLFLHLPPLRERTEDIPLFAEKYLQKDKPINYESIKFGQESIRLLQEYQWPGNIRELENVVERLLVFKKEGEIIPQDIASVIFQPESGENHGFMALADNERSIIMQALQMAGGNKAETAKLLGISRTTLWRKLKG